MYRLMTIALVALIAGVALGDEILLNSGDELEGEITKADETGVWIKVGEQLFTFGPDDLDLHSYYTAWSKRVPKEAKAHLRVAVFAYENGLFNQAKKHYGRAKRLDKDAVAEFERAVIPKIKEAVAEKLLEHARRALALKDMKAVKHFATKILTDLDDTRAAEKARAHIASLRLWQLDDDEKRALSVIARYLPKDEKKALAARKKITARVEPAEKALRLAQEKAARALQMKEKPRVLLLEQAGRRFQRVLEDLDKIAKAGRDDQALVAHVEVLRSSARRDGISAFVSAGRIHLRKGRLKEARAMGEAAQAIDPRSDEAAQLLKDVAIARSFRSSGWGGGFGWGFGY